MFTFKEYLEEKVLSIGLNPEHEHHREKFRNQMHDMLRASYASIGGYGGRGSGSEDESKAIHDDISNSQIKAVKRGDKLTAVRLYKAQHGRKGIAVATDGTQQGKRDMLKASEEDKKLKRSWSEVSGAPEKIFKRMGFPTVPAAHAEKLIGKKVEIQPDGEHYTREIGGHKHTKVILGYPKL